MSPFRGEMAPSTSFFSRSGTLKFEPSDLTFEESTWELRNWIALRLKTVLGAEMRHHQPDRVKTDGRRQRIFDWL